MGRSREGAWIEMSSLIFFICNCFCRSREGAWIEIGGVAGYKAERGSVAPARERGLKYQRR